MHEPRTEVSALPARPPAAALDAVLIPPPPLTGVQTTSRAPTYGWALQSARAIAEAVFSSGGGSPPAERIDWLSSELTEYVERAGWRSGGFYKLGLLLVALLAPLLIRRLPPLWRLPLEERVKALKAIERRFASVFLPVKAILCIIYYEHPDAARETGYPGGCPPKVGR